MSSPFSKVCLGAKNNRTLYGRTVSNVTIQQTFGKCRTVHTLKLGINEPVRLTEQIYYYYHNGNCLIWGFGISVFQYFRNS